MPDSNSPSGKSVIDSLEQAKRVYGIAIWLIEVGVVVVGFIKSAGGLIHFLVEAGAFGVACWIAYYPVGWLAWVIMKAFHLSEDALPDDAWAIVLGLAVLAGGALVRFRLLPHFPDTEHLDLEGTVFLTVVGIVVLAVPFLILWVAHETPPPK